MGNFQKWPQTRTRNSQKPENQGKSFKELLFDFGNFDENREKT